MSKNKSAQPFVAKMFRCSVCPLLPVTVNVQQEVGGADGEGNLVPLAIGQAVGEGFGARLAFEAVVVADFLSHAATLQFKVTAGQRRGA